MNTETTRMHLDRENSVWLGVCAGVANWLDVPAALVRIIFVICVLAWPPALVGYVVMWFCLDKDFTPDQVRDYFTDTPTAEHFRQLDYRKPIYRNERNQRIAGVCAGFADYLEVSAFSVRLVTLLSLFLFGPFTFWAYIICWFVLDRDPALTGDDGDSRRSRRQRRREQRRQRRAARHQARRERREARKTRKSYVNVEIHAEPAEINNIDEQSEAPYESGSDEARNERESSYRSRSECTELYSELEQRLRGIEAFMTSKKFRLHCEINRI